MNSDQWWNWLKYFSTISRCHKYRSPRLPNGGERSNAATTLPQHSERSNAAPRMHSNPQLHNAFPPARRAKQCRAPHAPTKHGKSSAHPSPCGEPKAMPHSPAGTGEPATVTRAPRSRARLIAPTNRRRLMAKPCTPQCTPQANRSFKPQTRNVRGRGARPLVFLSGDQKGDTLFEKRVSPFHCAPPPGYIKTASIDLSPAAPRTRPTPAIGRCATAKAYCSTWKTPRPM